MQITPTSQPAQSIDATCLVVGVFEGQTGTSLLSGTPAGELLGRLVEAKEVSTSLGDLTPILGASGLAAGSLWAVGLGPRDKFQPGGAFAAGVATSRKLAGKPRPKVAVAVPEGADEAIARALVEGLVVGTMGPGLRKKEPNRHPFDELLVVGPESLAPAVRQAEVVGEAVNLARELANLPPAEKPPTQLAARAREVSEGAGIAAEVWDLERIRREGFGGLLGVAAGSSQPPAFVTLQYRRGGDSPTLALVGKGVTFDSGGLSLKPSNSMEDMKADMTGAAVVLSAMQAAARLDLPINLSGYLALTENMTGGGAMKLGDVLTMRGGTTVEVLNTDAEGRLILADALRYAAEQKPARILDLATLTGACVVALGTKIAGLFSPDEAFAAQVSAASQKTGERVWRMPLDDDFDEMLKSTVADVKNVSGAKWAGAITAAKFLQRFVGETPWAHLDIAGPSWAESESATRDAGATGCFVRTLVRLFEMMVEPNGGAG